MIKDRPIVALFDNDGVILDTESQYSVFWGAVGRKYHPEIPNFDHVIKGQTLVYILNTYFPDMDLQKQVVEELYEFEENMDYGYIPGVFDFIQELKEHGVKTVVVTSSDQSKMNHVYRSHPEFRVMFDRILTSEDFKASKPDPYCYLLGAELFNAPLENCMVFEDSFNGLKAGMAADIFTVGVATTNSRDSIESKSDYVIDDFRDFSYSKMMDLLH